MRIACIGEAMIELSMRGQTNANVGVAGDTLNTAIYMHRSAPNLEVDYITHLGDDPFSDQIADFIAQQGVGTQGITRVQGASPGMYAISTTDAGERSFTYWRSAAAARGMFQTPTGPNFDSLQAYDALYISGISMAILPHEVRLAMIDWLKATDITLIYDSNYRPRLWDTVQDARHVTDEMWARANIALPSIDDEMMLYCEDEAQVTQRFLKRKATYPASTGALKRGPEGPLSLGEPVHQTYMSAANVIDTTAAGDSFNGAYLGALLTDAAQAEALMAGHNRAAHVVQHRGAIVAD